MLHYRYEEAKYITVHPMWRPQKPQFAQGAVSPVLLQTAPSDLPEISDPSLLPPPAKVYRGSLPFMFQETASTQRVCATVGKDALDIQTVPGYGQIPSWAVSDLPQADQTSARSLSFHESDQRTSVYVVQYWDRDVPGPTRTITGGNLLPYNIIVDLSV